MRGRFRKIPAFMTLRHLEGLHARCLFRADCRSRAKTCQPQCSLLPAGSVRVVARVCTPLLESSAAIVNRAVRYWEIPKSRPSIMCEATYPES
jgi:hypothetical protein